MNYKESIIKVLQDNDFGTWDYINIMKEIRVKFPEEVVQSAIDWIKEELKKNPPELRKQWLHDSLMNLQAKL